MANCFQCGEYIAPTDHHYRRQVYTGMSMGGWASKRSRGSSVRAHMGVRTVCFGCAKRQDDAAKVTLAVLGGLAILFLAWVFVIPRSSRRVSSPSVGSSYVIDSRPQVEVTVETARLRALASTEGAVLGTARRGQRLLVLSTDGDWYEVASPDRPTFSMGFVHRSLVGAAS